MQFLYPQFLFALFAVSIPIIIHLFNFRRFKKIYFSDIRFLKEIKQESRHRNRIKHILILLARILAVSFLIFAFSQPFLQVNNKNPSSYGGIQAVSIYVDNSFSMENVSKNGMLLDEAKNIAREVALSHSQTDLFQLLTNDFEEKHQRFVSREEFLTMLGEIKISPAVKTISEIITRQSDMLGKAEMPRTENRKGSGIKNKKSFLITDFQKSISDFEKVKNDSSVNVILIPVPAEQQNNLYIDSCWFESPVHQLNEAEKLNVRIKNISNSNIENIPVKLFLNNQQKSPSSFSIAPDETKDISLSFVLKEPGIQQGRIEITDYPVTYDDKFYFSFYVEKNIPVMCISAASSALKEANENYANKSIQSLFGKDSLFVLNMQEENKIDYSGISSQQVIVLCELKNISSGLAQELNRFVKNGGSLVVFPSAETDTFSYKNFLSSLGANFYQSKDTSNTKVDWINLESEIFSDVFKPSDAESGGKKEENMDLPVVHSHYSQTRFYRTNEEILLKIRNGDSFFSKYSYGKGKTYLSAVPLNTQWSNFVQHAIFVPLMYKIALHSQPASGLFYTIGKNNFIPAVTKNHTEEPFKIKGVPPLQNEIIPESRITDMQPVIFVREQIKEAGNYKLTLGSEIIKGVSFNYDRKESDLSRYTPDELISLCKKNALKNFSLINAENKDIGKVLADISQGKKLWKWCVVLVLFFLAVETVLIRLWK